MSQVIGGAIGLVCAAVFLAASAGFLVCVGALVVVFPPAIIGVALAVWGISRWIRADRAAVRHAKEIRNLRIADQQEQARKDAERAYRAAWRERMPDSLA